MCAQHQRIVAAAAQVNTLNRGNAPRIGVGNVVQIQRDAGAIELECVNAATAIDLRPYISGCKRTDVAGIEHHHIVARAAEQHIGAARANQRVVAKIAHQGFIACAAGQGIGTGGAELVYLRLPCRAVCCAENHIAFA